MANRIVSRLREIRNTGFGSNVGTEPERLLNKDGSFNIKKKGLSFSERFSIFHSLITMSWTRFMFYVFICYLIINTFFAVLYLCVGFDGISGTSAQALDMQFLEAFYFSTQTLTTVGYGNLSPQSTGVNLVASFEAFVGLLSFAMATGLLYGRFSRPQARLLSSTNALISPYLDGKGLMFRIANAKDSQLINVEAGMNFSIVENNGETKKRKFYFLDLEMDKINILATSWTLVHPINDNSPLHGLDLSDLVGGKAEVFYHIQAYDESYSQNVNVRSSYKFDEIVFNAKFKPILSQEDSSYNILHLDQIDDYDLV